ncbi:TonB-dependent siderophore receptor [Methylophilus sp. QUAN]|uniref:TonB-dependent receptor n=1 Tax=Methylophilus sp. QUAN TaxID=2781020 RepID=UPI0018902193|nr:TonB-dependent receptor [Methylophilus sp. QUAN]MBF4992179.1 TonB-dependent receptor [Methylophilus sp. QUAN]
MPSGFNKKTMTLALMMALPAVAMAADEEKKADAAQTMTEVKVKSQRIQDAPNKGYQATKTRVGKTYQDPQDVPQAVTTLTRELLHDQQVGSLREALRNVVGLSVNAAEGGRAGDNFNLRGFYTFGDIYLDNMRDTAQYNRETFNLEQVDVLRGSAAMLFGRGQAGGVINQVSKMAELRDKNTVTGSVGNYDYHQLTGDFNKQLTETAAIRVNVMDRHDETYRKNPTTGDRPEFDRQGIAISFGAGIGTENEFFLNHIYTQTRDVPDFGIRFLNKRPLSNGTNGRSDRTFWGSSNNFDDSDTRITTGIFTHKFDDDTQLRTQLRHARYKRSYWAKTPADALPLVNDRVGGNVTRVMDYETVNLQSDFSTKFDLAGMKHSVLTGVEYLKENSYRSTLQPYDPVTGAIYTQTGDTLTNAILANPNGVAFRGNFANITAAPNRFDADNYAVYVQDSIEFIPHWTVLAGIRRDEMHANYSSATNTKLSYGENSYRTGLSWQPNADRHYYLTFSDSFSPTADLYQLTVQPLPAERARTLELGSKWLFMDGDLAVRTAVFTTTKDWERNTDLESTASILTKRRRTNGVEFEVTGKITDRWDMFAGFALLDARIINVAQNYVGNVLTTADTRFEGERARNTPIGTFNLWTTYALTDAWKIGGGVEAKGERYAYVPSAARGTARGQTEANGGVFQTGVFDPNKAPGYARVDLMATYEQPKWAVRLNVKNLLNKVYYDAVYDNGGLVTPGNGRQAIITTEYKF